MTRRKPLRGRHRITERARRFAAEYLVDFNAKEAAIRAGYSPRCAKQTAYKMLRWPAVAALVDASKARARARVDATVDDIVDELRRVGFADIRTFFDAQGRLLPIDQLSPDAASALASVEVVTRRVPGGDATDVEYVAKIRSWDKVHALELLGKRLGLFPDRVRHEGAVGIVPLTPEQAARLSTEDLQAIVAIAKKAQGEDA